MCGIRSPNSPCALYDTPSTSTWEVGAARVVRVECRVAHSGNCAKAPTLAGWAVLHASAAADLVPSATGSSP